jgi:hypothetical protein
MTFFGWAWVALFAAAGAAVLGFGSMNGNGARVGRPMFWAMLAVTVLLVVLDIARRNRAHPLAR